MSFFKRTGQEVHQQDDGETETFIPGQPIEAQPSQNQNSSKENPNLAAEQGKEIILPQTHYHSGPGGESSERNG